MNDEDILKLINDSLYGFKYILDRDNPRSTYIETIIEDIKYKLKNENK